MGCCLPLSIFFRQSDTAPLLNDHSHHDAPSAGIPNGSSYSPPAPIPGDRPVAAQNGSITANNGVLTTDNGAVTADQHPVDPNNDAVFDILTHAAKSTASIATAADNGAVTADQRPLSSNDAVSDILTHAAKSTASIATAAAAASGEIVDPAEPNFEYGVIPDKVTGALEPGADDAKPTINNGTNSNELVDAAQSMASHGADSGKVARPTADDGPDSGDDENKSSTSSDSSDSEKKYSGGILWTKMVKGSAEGDLIKKEKETEEKKKKKKKEKEEKKEHKHHHRLTQKLHDLKDRIKEDGSRHLQDMKDQMIGADQGSLIGFLGNTGKHMLMSFRSEPEDAPQDAKLRLV